MINIELWRHNMTEAVREIADDEFQRRVWLGAGPEVSSPDEAYNMLLDDFQFEAFLALADNGLSDTQREKGTALVASLKRYCSFEVLFSTRGIARILCRLGCGQIQ